MKAAFTIVGTLCALTGIVWMLQGAGYVGGSFMSGEPRWLGIGLVTAVVGAALLVWARWRG